MDLHSIHLLPAHMETAKVVTTFKVSPQGDLINDLGHSTCMPCFKKMCYRNVRTHQTWFWKTLQVTMRVAQLQRREALADHACCVGMVLGCAALQRTTGAMADNASTHGGTSHSCWCGVTNQKGPDSCLALKQECDCCVHA